MRSRSYRRHQTETHMNRRLTEDSNQHYNDLSCACYQPGKAMARFKEQPKTCSNPYHGCGHVREIEGRTLNERRYFVVRYDE